MDVKEYSFFYIKTEDLSRRISIFHSYEEMRVKMNSFIVVGKKS
jgi:hypothetical protein